MLYRATALAAQRQGVSAEDEAGVAAVATRLDLRFDGERVLLSGEDVALALRLEAVGAMASKIAALPLVRAALNALQLSFRKLPGLVADGRDMGTVLFPGAPLKVFLTASPAQRAERRHKQLISKGIPANIADLRADLEARDLRDRSRPVAPLKPAEDALLLDNSGLSIDESVDQVLRWWAERNPFG
jgi:3-phosphoshikimate 1-carboxyvinyltransferase